MKHTIKNQLLYKIIRSIFGFFGSLIGVFLGFAFFYPFILAFPNKLLMVLFEVYLVIFLAIGFYKIFSVGFVNYVNYKPIFYNSGLKLILSKKNFALSFYFFGIVLFIYFISGF